LATLLADIIWQYTDEILTSLYNVITKNISETGKYAGKSVLYKYNGLWFMFVKKIKPNLETFYILS
jgi:hypothetical protein